MLKEERGDRQKEIERLGCERQTYVFHRNCLSMLRLLRSIANATGEGEIAWALLTACGGLKDISGRER